MKTTVTSYLVKENEELVFDADTRVKWQEIIEKLELDGQKALSNAKEGEGNPIPFLWMNRRAKGMFAILCPMKVELKKYEKSPIPLEALSLIALANEQAYFKSIRIWYDDKAADPIAVGEASGGELYLIARWGAEDKSLQALEDEAYKKCREDTKRQLESKISECKSKLGDLEIVVEGRMNDNWFYV